jgi:2-polyprenyl-6-hydroxyphenyl methylase/3-demethylubiquinone-9 3-methyltransferase
MYIVSRSVRFLRGALLSYGPQGAKRVVWNKEYSRDKWKFADSTVGDWVYASLEKYAAKGSILDLGCGSGNTATELADEAYSSYTGVDISEEALAKAAARSEAKGRGSKNRFARADFLSFQPDKQFDVVLFRESMYHIPIRKILPILTKYAIHLKENGVFIVRMYTIDGGEIRSRPEKMIEIITKNFEVVEREKCGTKGAAILVFRPKYKPAIPDSIS